MGGKSMVPYLEPIPALLPQVLSLLLMYKNGTTLVIKTHHRLEQGGKGEGLLIGDYQELWAKHLNNEK